MTESETSNCVDRRALSAVRAAVLALPYRFERLVCITSLQDPEARGQFCHLLPLVQDWEKVDLALCREHHEIFEDWLGLALEDKLVDLESYAAGRGVALADIAHRWFFPERCDSLVPRGALPPEKRLFQGDVEMLLMILASKGVIPAW